MEIKDRLAQAGIRLNGDRAWDIQVDEKDLPKVFESDLSLGETWMDRVWDSKELDETYFRLRPILKHLLKDKRFDKRKVQQSLVENLQTKDKSTQVIEQHYDLGNDLYEVMLGPTMSYTCGYWEEDWYNLSDAQCAKNDLVCLKLGLRPGMKVLDLGCGFGSFAYHAAREYGVEVHGISLSQEQINYAEEFCKGLDCTFEVNDYRNAKGKYDAVLSMGMFEHIGHMNYRNYMKTCYKVLNPEGKSFIQTSGLNASQTIATPWIEKYIFPNGMLPSAKQITESMEVLFVLEDWHNLSTNYYKTIKTWWENVDRGRDQLSYDDRFYRMWEYYLLTSAACYNLREYNLWQIVMTKLPTTGTPKYCRYT